MFLLICAHEQLHQMGAAFKKTHPFAPAPKGNRSIVSLVVQLDSPSGRTSTLSTLKIKMQICSLEQQLSKKCCRPIPYNG